VGGPWNGNLARRGIHQLAAGKFFDQIGIDGSRFEERYAMLKALTIMRLLIKNGLAYAQRCSHVLERMKAARAKQEVIAEIKNGRAANGGNNK
jgi:hypothetical protein